MQDEIGRYTEMASHILQTHTDHEMVALGDLLPNELKALKARLQRVENVFLTPNQSSSEATPHFCRHGFGVARLCVSERRSFVAPRACPWCTWCHTAIAMRATRNHSTTTTTRKSNTLSTPCLSPCNRDRTGDLCGRRCPTSLCGGAQASQEERQLVTTLVEKGQLEFIGGGWVMHDEADTSVYATLNQMTLGLQFLNETLNVRPRHEWHIDPFGHSIFMAELYSLLGYTSIILNRVPDSVKQQMRADKSLEFMWRSPFSGREIFTHVLDTSYSTPALPAFLSLEVKVAMLVAICKEKLGWYMTDHVLVPFGNDFAFQNATKDFASMDEIVDAINSNSTAYGLTIRYSTLSEYMDAVLSAGVTFPSRGGDFLPYIACSPCEATLCFASSNPCGVADSFWSGFYTSKPAQKLLSGVQDASLRALETIRALSLFLGNGNVEEALVLAKNTSAIMQHHDAITGTSFTESYNDYNVRLGKALTAGDEGTSFMKAAILCSASPVTYTLSSDSVSVLSGLTEANIAVVVVQNTLPHDMLSYVSVQLPQDVCVQVLDAKMATVGSQVVGSMVYFVVQASAGGMEVYYMKKASCEEQKPVGDLAQFSISNGAIELNFNATNHLVGWSSPTSNGSHSVEQEYIQYVERKAFLDFNVCDGTNVYTFVPQLEDTLVLTPKKLHTTITANGPLVWEVTQTLNSYLNNSIRLFKPLSSDFTDQYSNFVEWQTNIGPLPSDNASSFTSSFRTDLSTDSFVTYSNGIYPMRRTYNSSILLQGNTYPLVGGAHFDGASPQTTFSVLARRPMGVAAHGGIMEIMLHRRLPILFDPRGDDDSVMTDSVLLGFVSSGMAQPITMATSMSFTSPPTLHFADVHVLGLDLLDVHQDVFEVAFRIINGGLQPQSVDVGAFFKLWDILAIQETTPDYQEVHENFKGDDVTVALNPLQLRSFVAQIKTNQL
ncbi:hypothetical protein EMCRGX_G013852 [Ephydatia muelleri]